MEGYPLTWPPGWRRAKSFTRTRARFSNQGREITVAEAAQRIMNSLGMLDVPAGEIIVSTNIQPRLDYLPRSGQPEPSDPGAAVYWKKRGISTHKVMAIDRYDRVAGNLAAVAATLEAMRLIERHGGAEILDRAFTGFTALPAPINWRQILGLDGAVTLEDAREQYKKLSRIRHPDVGGSEPAMAELNRAWQEAQEQFR